MHSLHGGDREDVVAEELLAESMGAVSHFTSLRMSWKVCCVSVSEKRNVRMSVSSVKLWMQKTLSSVVMTRRLFEYV